MSALFLPAPLRSKKKKAPRAPKPKTTNTELALTTTASNVSSGFGNDAVGSISIPSYEERCQAAIQEASGSGGSGNSKGNNKGMFVPRSVSDFSDGGSFPEIHVAQYPKNMGNPHKKTNDASSTGGGGGSSSSAGVGSSTASTRAILAVQTDADGKKDYTSLITSTGTNASKTVYAKHQHVKPHNPTPDQIALPTEEEITNTTQKTADVIQSLLSSKTALAKPSGSALLNAATSQNQQSKTQFVSYKPNPNAPGYNPVAAKRVIQMVPKQLDPMAPPKHEHKKAPRGPAEDFTPVLHAPPEKLTKEEREAWNIPACISNWKNTRGYTIPLDKRLAADGRGLREEGTINSNFATLSESLFVAERQAREEVRMRALVKKRQVENERERRERELRDLAFQARKERSGGLVTGTDLDRAANDDGNDNNVATSGGEEDNVVGRKNANDSPVKTNGLIPHIVPSDDDDDSSSDGESSDSDEDNNKSSSKETSSSSAVAQREKLREERRKERVRELRMEQRKKPNKSRGEEDDDENGVTIKKARLEGDRDVSEKIALGVHTGSSGLGGGVDSRLYNQNAGLDSGFGAEDEYNTYTKGMFDRSGVTSSSIYRPTRGEGAMDGDEQYAELKKNATSKFQPDKGFAGAEGGVAPGSGGGSGANRTAPVQFEKGGSK